MNQLTEITDTDLTEAEWEARSHTVALAEYGATVERATIIASPNGQTVGNLKAQLDAAEESAEKAKRQLREGTELFKAILREIQRDVLAATGRSAQCNVTNAVRDLIGLYREAKAKLHDYEETAEQYCAPNTPISADGIRGHIQALEKERDTAQDKAARLSDDVRVEKKEANGLRSFLIDAAERCGFDNRDDLGDSRLMWVLRPNSGLKMPIEIERDQARANAELLLDALRGEVRSLHRWSGHHRKVGDCEESEVCQRFNETLRKVAPAQ